MCQGYNSKVNSFPCCSPMFIMTKMLPKVTILKVMQNIQLKVVIFMKIKKSLVEIDRLPKISFQFLSSGPRFSFLSDPSPILVYPCHWLIPWLTDSLTHSCLVNLINVTLVCEDGNSRLIEVVTVVEVDDEKHVDNSLVQIWKINFWS